jgi:hypothetical protein
LMAERKIDRPRLQGTANAAAYGASSPNFPINVRLLC